METETPAPRHRPRAWLLTLLGLAIVGLIAYQMWPEQSATLAAPTSNRGRSARPAESQGALDPAALKVRLEALQAKRPDHSEVERNPFRFRPPPAPPPPPKLPEPPPMPVGPPLPPPPPPIPPIPLKFMGTGEQGKVKLAAFTDCKGSTYSGEEGAIIDGRYRIVRIQTESAVVEYVNGTGRMAIKKSGDCPK